MMVLVSDMTAFAGNKTVFVPKADTSSSPIPCRNRNRSKSICQVYSRKNYCSEVEQQVAESLMTLGDIHLKEGATEVAGQHPR